MAKIILDNRWIYAEGVSFKTIHAISRATSYLQAGYKHTSAFKSRQWDGRRKLITMSGSGILRAPAGLAQEVVDMIEGRGDTVVVEDRRRRAGKRIEYGFSAKLRDYQEEAVDAATKPRGSLGLIGRGIIKLPTRSGKTVVAAAIISRLGARTLFITPSTLLLYQSQESLQRNLGVPVGIVGDGKWDPREVTVASVQTLVSRRGASTRADPSSPEFLQLLSSVDLIVSDECFPDGTMVGDRKIEDVKVGDLVPSIDPETMEIVHGRVIGTSRRVATGLVALRLENGVVLSPTPNHPFWVWPGRWARASDLTCDDMVLYTTYDENETKPSSILSYMPESDNDFGETIRSIQKNGARLLLSGVLNGLPSKNIVGDDGENQSEICVGTDDPKQPDDAAMGSRKTESIVARDRLETSSAGRKREAPTNCSTQPCRGAELADRGRGTDSDGSQQWISDRLQNRHSEPDAKNSDRGRRSYAQLSGETGTGSKKRGIPHWVRVESVTLQKSRSDCGLGSVRNENYVNNLEVDGNHTYIANGVLVHNCHHLKADIWRNAIQEANAEYKIGLSATVFLDHERETELGAIWLRAATGDMLVDVSTSELIERGYLVRPEIRIIPIREPADLAGRGWSKTLQNEAIFANPIRNQRIVKEAIALVREGLQTVIITNRIDQVNRICSMLDAGPGRDIYASLIGNDPQTTRQWVIDRFRNGELQILVSTVLDEGVDIPEIGAIINAEGGVDIKSTYQRLRCLTPAPGKTRAVVVDFLDMTHAYFAAHSRARIEVYRGEKAFRIRALPG